MRSPALIVVLLAALAASACFQMTTVVSVKGDGSGTIEHTMLLMKAALAQLRQFGGGGRVLDLVSEDQARAMAASLGPGVTFVGSSPIDTPLAEGRRSQYAFADINQLRISEQPDAPAGLNARTQSLSTDSVGITCSFTHDPNGNAVLRINLPEPKIQSAFGGATPGSPALGQQLAMVRVLLAGARIVIGVEPAGQIVRTTSPYVDGQRVTLVDVNLDELLGNEALLARLQGATNADEVKAALKDVPGLKLTLDREVTIEFTPAK